MATSDGSTPGRSFVSLTEVSRPSHRLAWLNAIREPHLALDWPLPEWERILRLARRTRLLARLAEALASAGLTERVPPQPRRHLIAEQRLSRQRTAAMVWTLERIAAALGEVDFPLVLLKGAAYVGQALPIAAGRLPSDLDILVPRNCLAYAQARLVQAGWQEVELDEHDRRYYYEWSHEVPPLRHPLLPLELDLHHNILPPVANTHVNTDALLERLQPSRWASWQVLHPVDQVLHSAAHLFHDSELRDRIRDLVDLDGLLRDFGAQSGFWPQLPERARSLGLSEPLALACHFCVDWFGTPIASDILQSIMATGPGRARRAWLLPLLNAVLTPAEPEQKPPVAQEFAAMLLLARYHRQRMPMRILLPHLWHKVRAVRVKGGSVQPGTI
jgi:Uncharacterised nucleotidyltransferase